MFMDGMQFVSVLLVVFAITHVSIAYLQFRRKQSIILSLINYYKAESEEYLQNADFHGNTAANIVIEQISKAKSLTEGQKEDIARHLAEQNLSIEEIINLFR